MARSLIEGSGREIERVILLRADLFRLVGWKYANRRHHQFELPCNEDMPCLVRSRRSLAAFADASNPFIAPLLLGSFSSCCDGGTAEKWK
jgi:hypothetical protein